jgi:HK97 gp10 family phage protein
MNAKINPQDLAILDKKLKQLKRFSRQELSTEVGRTASDIVKRSTKRVPVDKGKLKQSVYMAKKGNTAEVGYNKKYAPYQEFGTGRYINTKDAEALGFSAGEIKQLFEGKGTRQVNIPPQPYFFPSVREALKALMFRLDDKLKKYI